MSTHLKQASLYHSQNTQTHTIMETLAAESNTIPLLTAGSTEGSRLHHTGIEPASMCVCTPQGVWIHTL